MADIHSDDVESNAQSSTRPLPRHASSTASAGPAHEVADTIRHTASASMHRAASAGHDAKVLAGHAVGNIGEMSSEAAEELRDTLKETGTHVLVLASQAQKTVDEVVINTVPDLPALPTIPVLPTAKRGDGMLRIGMLQQMRRQDDANYRAGWRLSVAEERLLRRVLFYLFSFIALALMISSFVLQVGVGTANQAAIWAASSCLMGFSLAFNTRIPVKEPQRIAGWAGMIITISTFVAFIFF